MLSALGGYVGGFGMASVGYYMWSPNTPAVLYLIDGVFWAVLLLGGLLVALYRNMSFMDAWLPLIL